MKIKPETNLTVEGGIKTTTSVILEDPGAGTNTTTIQAGTVSSSYTLTLPAAQGGSSQTLQNNGSGVLSWNTPFTISELGTITSEPTGFVTRTSSRMDAVHDGSTYINFYIEPTSTSFDYYIQGVKYTKSTRQEVNIDRTSKGLHFIYFNGGTLTAAASVTKSTFISNALVAILYIGSSYTVQILSDERHGTTMDGETHYHLHTNQGTIWTSGGSLSAITADGDGSSNSHATVTADKTTIEDEDIQFVISAKSTFPVFYHESDGTWTSQAASAYPVVRFPSGDQRLAYNRLSGGTWSQVQVDNSSFVLSHIFATNSYNTGTPQDCSFIAIQGQNQYANLASAREGATTEINSIITTGLPIKEFYPLGTIIYQTNTSYANAVKARIRTTDEGGNYVDFRYVDRPSSGITSDHGNLAGLVDDDHLQYLKLAGRSGGQTIYGGTAASENLTLISTSNPTLGQVIVQGSLKTTTSLVLEDPGAGANTTTIQAGTVSSSYTLTLPTAQGSANELLKGDGSGNLSWTKVVLGIAGDIAHTSFSGANNQSSAANVTGLAFDNASVRAFEAIVSVYINATAPLYEVFTLRGVQKASSWDMSVTSNGDDSNVDFTITSAGQVQYTSGNESGFSASTFKFRAIVTAV